MSENVSVTVEILDKEYMISCPASEKDALLESARELNQRMRELRDGGKVLGTERMAVMTALNVINEHLRQKNTYHATVSGIEEDARRLEQKIERAIGRRRQPETVD
ncbi:MAG: cell division protein ZapA [Gammaproteobacteria bacterium]|nr:cell division protein ZapA [Gammaproteobacteria bacterium]